MKKIMIFMLINRLKAFTFLAVAIVPSINLLAMHMNSSHVQAPHRDMQDFSGQKSQHSSYRDPFYSHENFRPTSSWLAEETYQPERSYQQKESQLSPRQEQQQKLNFVALGASYFGDALGLKSQGWLLEKENKAPELQVPVENSRDPAFDFSHLRKEGLFADKVPVELDRDIAQTEHAQAFRDQRMQDIQNNYFVEVRSRERSLPENFNYDKLQEYKDYYGVAFGPMFFKLYESTPEFLKSTEGFQKAATDFFKVFAFRVEHLGKTEGYLWTEYAADAWSRFTQIWVNKFDEDGMIEPPVEGIRFGQRYQGRSGQSDYNHSRRRNRRNSGINSRVFDSREDEYSMPDELRI